MPNGTNGRPEVCGGFFRSTTPPTDWRMEGYALPAIWVPAARAATLGDIFSRAVNDIRKRIVRMRGRIS
jgi:hypothetical protein